MSRDISRFERPELLVELKKRAKEELSLDIGWSCIDRTIQEQQAYWSRGREPLAVVNTLYKLAGLDPITQADNRRKITWTMNSKHIVNPEDINRDNDLSRAADFFVIYKGKAVWDVKADVDKDSEADYVEVGKLAESMGFRWGGRFKDKQGRDMLDPCHVELT